MEKELGGLPVLVTGAGGFIGSHLVEHLLNLGADVTALVRYNSRSTNGWLDDSELRESMVIERGDIRDRSYMRALCAGKKIIFNLAALIGIPYSYHAPESYFDVNLCGALNILDFVRANPECTLVQLSTSEVYGSAQFTPISETHPLQPQSPYSASKISADAASLSYFSAFDSKVILARPFNTYGPRQSMRAVIPAILAQLFSGSAQIELGNLSARRDFCFVRDTVEFLVNLSLSEHAIGEAVNIGTGNSISINDLVELIFEISGMQKPIKVTENRLRPEKSEVDNLECDPTKLIKTVGCVPTISLEEGLEQTITWFKASKFLENQETDRFHL
jgi:NAD dependent epimerase/dehydratase